MTTRYEMVFPVGIQAGLTKREYFAAIAMQGLIAAGTNAPLPN